MKRPSPSMAVALVALFVALGGTATAAKVLITRSTQIKAGVVKRSDIAKNAIDSSRVADGSLSTSDLDAATQSALTQSGGGKALEVVRAGGPTNVQDGKEATVITLADIPAGAYALFAKTNVSGVSSSGVLAQGQSVSGACRVETGDETDKGFVLIGTPGSNSNGTINLQLTKTFSGTGTVRMVCSVSGANWSAGGASIIALPISSPNRQSVDAR